MRTTSRVEKKIRKKKIGLIIVILFFISSIFFVLFTKTDFFNVNTIEVMNNNKLTTDEVVKASGFVMDENIFMINTTQLEDNLSEHPYIKDGTVKRNFPNKIVIHVNERNDFMLITYIGSILHLDNEGVLVNISTDIENENLPIVNGLQINNPELGKKLLLPDERDVLDIVNFLELSNVVGLYKQIDNLEVNGEFDINFQLKTGTRVAFGDLNNVKYKLSFIVEILDSLYESGDLNEDNASQGLIDLTKGEDAVFTLEGN